MNYTTTNNLVNKKEDMAESCNYKLPPIVPQKNKSKMRVHLSKPRQENLKKLFIKVKTKEEPFNDQIVKNALEKSSRDNGNSYNMKKLKKTKDTTNKSDKLSLPISIQLSQINLNRIWIKNKTVENEPSTKIVKDISKKSTQNNLKTYNGDIGKPITVGNELLQSNTLRSSTNIPSPKVHNIYNCNHSCVEWTAYDQNKANEINMLAIPLNFGFNRHIIGTTHEDGIQKYDIYYETPCGLSIQNMEEMLHYLIVTNNKMSIDQFDFNSCVNPLAQFKFGTSIRFLEDLSNGLEIRPITCVNNINDELPPKINYLISRTTMDGVNINMDTNFLCGCDCTDNCQDKSKCACWKSTIEGQRNTPNYQKHSNAGYTYRRLNESVSTGIYECNKKCKCNSLCLNRVVQQPMSQNLQLFKTKNKGWGVRCLNDITKGAFICCYIGNILTDDNATEQGKNYGDEYLADLDFIEVVEKLKEGYEEDVISSQQDNKIHKLSKKTMDLLNKLATQKSSNCHIQTTSKGNIFFSRNNL